MLKFFRWSLRHCACSLLVSAAPTSLSLLFSFPSIWLSLCARHSFLYSIFPFTLIPGRNCFLSPPVLSGYKGSPDTRFSRATTRLMNWPDRKRYLFSHHFFAVSLLLSLVFTLLFSWTGGILSHQSSLAHRFPRFPPRNLCFYVMLAVFSLVFAATDTSFLLSFYLSRIGRIENPSCSACGHPSQDTSHFILHCPATDLLPRSLFGNFLSLYDLWSRPWGVARLVGPHGLPSSNHPSEGVGKQQQQQNWNYRRTIT